MARSTSSSELIDAAFDELDYELEVPYFWSAKLFLLIKLLSIPSLPLPLLRVSKIFCLTSWSWVSLKQDLIFVFSLTTSFSSSYVILFLDASKRFTWLWNVISQVELPSYAFLNPILILWSNLRCKWVPVVAFLSFVMLQVLFIFHFGVSKGSFYKFDECLNSSIYFLRLKVS